MSRFVKVNGPGDRRDDWNRNDYYLGDPRLNRAYRRAKIAAEEKLPISDLLGAALVSCASVPLCSTLIFRNEQLPACNSPEQFKMITLVGPCMSSRIGHLLDSW